MHSPHLATATSDALELALGTDAPHHDAALRDAIRRLCADARCHDMRPEQLIVLFKMTWRAHPELRAPQPHRTAVLEQIVTMCIQEYYRTSGPG